MATAKPIMLRAALTPEEYRELRKWAIEEGVATSGLTAMILRKAIEDRKDGDNAK